jgi:hypothetical protein
VDFERRQHDAQWLDLISECGFIIGLLTKHGAEAVRRVETASSPRWDAYPASSLPDSSIGGGRYGDPVGRTVVRHAGGLDADGEGADKDDATTPDIWKERYDPIGMAVRKMVAESCDASNRLATAQQAAHTAQGLSGGQVFGVIQMTDNQGAPITQYWQPTLDSLTQAFTALKGMANDVIDAPDTPERKAGRKRIERELFDAKNRLRTAERSMREAIPQPIADVSREVCASCGTSKDISTWWGQKPRQWIASEAKCRECVERPKRHAKGRKAS